MPRAYTKQQLEERYQKLPDILKEAIFSAEVAEKLFEIGKKNGLTIEKVGFMAEETGRVILGLTRPSEFAGVLAERLGVSADAAQKIASDINHQIFFPLREALKQTHQIEVNEEAIQAPTPLPAGGGKPERQKVPLVDLSGLKVPTAPTGGPPGFLSKEEVEKIVAQKKAATPPPPAPKIPPIDLRIAHPPQPASLSRPTPPPPPTPPTQLSPQVPPPSPPAPPQLTPAIPAAPPSSPPEPFSKIPAIDLRQPLKPPAPEKPKPKPWQGYDPYKEPIE